MKFLTQDELETYYGKEYSQISPTDTPLPEYVCGHETMDCLSCGNNIQIECGGLEMGLTEIAYCPECEIKFERNREIVVEETVDDDFNFGTSTNYEYSDYRTDEREEYVCRYCKKRHPITKPMNDFTQANQNPKIQSLEQVQIPCPCGKHIDISGFNIPFEKSCPKCSRNYSFEISN